MYTCAVCHFATELDDVAVQGPGNLCVCLRCYARETGSERPMSTRLRREALATLADCCVV